LPNYNKAIVAGHLARDPELRITNGGQFVCKITVATSRKWRDKASGDTKEEVSWIPVTAWGRTAENIAKYLGKGSAILIEGRMRTFDYEKDGRKIYSWELVAENMQFLGGKKDSGVGSSAPSSDYHSPDTGKSDGDEEIPF
jgi:single-strand DNA-binding protein